MPMAWMPRAEAVAVASASSSMRPPPSAVAVAVACGIAVAVIEPKLAIRSRPAPAGSITSALEAAGIGADVQPSAVDMETAFAFLAELATTP